MFFDWIYFVFYRAYELGIIDNLTAYSMFWGAP